jgi:amino acid permease
MRAFNKENSIKMFCFIFIVVVFSLVTVSLSLAGEYDWIATFIDVTAKVITDPLGIACSGLVVLALVAYNAGPGAAMYNMGVPPYPEKRRYFGDTMHQAQRSTAIPEFVAAMNFHPSTYKATGKDVSAENLSSNINDNKSETEA